MSNNKRWGRADKAYIEENYGRLSLETMAKHLNRSTMAVRLYALRHRLGDKYQVVKENRLKKLLSYRFRHLEDFTPSKAFYKETGINQVRYYDLFFGRKPITAKEYTAVADYFGVTNTESFEALQLSLFDQ